MRILLQPAFVLHHRPYRETSLLLDFFTENQGRMSAVARGVRKPKSLQRSLLQPFTPVLISVVGKTDLLTLTQVEPNGATPGLRGEKVLNGLYLNELLTRLLPKHDPYPALYTIYQQTLLELSRLEKQQQPLRLFEKRLLEELGYALQLKTSFDPEKQYRFDREEGFAESQSHTSTTFSGKSLQAIANEDLNDPVILTDAKRLMRMALSPLLGDFPLQSRKLYQQFVTLE